MNVVSDLERLQVAYTCLKTDNLDEKTYTVNDANREFLDEVYNQFPLRIEEYHHLYTRSQVTKNFIRNYLKFTDIKEGQKVACVAHSSFLKAMSAEGVDHDKLEIIGGLDMKNCQISPDTTYVN